MMITQRDMCRLTARAISLQKTTRKLVENSNTQRAANDGKDALRKLYAGISQKGVDTYIQNVPIPWRENSYNKPCEEFPSANGSSCNFPLFS